ncbi:MAG: phage-shock protein, partial [Planctomycetes bacterium]|nr:phage-shock protein [Planctomycetota bacterium]
AILCSFFLKVLRIIFGRSGKKQNNPTPESGALNAEETRLIQEIYQGLEKLEQRIEALETILLRKG